MQNRIKYKAKYKDRNLGLCSREEFYEFAYADQSLPRMFMHWKDNGNNMWLKPTVDRIDNDKGYVIGNMQFLTHKDNTAKGDQ